MMVPVPDYLEPLTGEERDVVARARQLKNSKQETAHLQEGDRQGMRAFLQRAETRLSTYHRVAGVFLNGAGLLILLPSIARESILVTALALTTAVANLPGKIDPGLALAVPFLIALGLPLYAFYLLLRDLVHFYFSPTFLEYDPIDITRFALAGVTLPFDESTEAKAHIIALKEADDSFVNFVQAGISEFAPRDIKDLNDAGKLSFPLRFAIQRAFLELDEQKPKNKTRDFTNGKTEPRELTNSEKIGLAFSRSGSLDLSLIGEVARMEASICRHALQLRKLVLRYCKALLLFVWTTLCMILGSAALGVGPQPTAVSRSNILGALVVYACWAGAAYFIVHRPIRWIGDLAAKAAFTADKKAAHTAEQTNSISAPAKKKPKIRDHDLLSFERVAFWCAIICGLWSITSAIVIYAGIYSGTAQ